MPKPLFQPNPQMNGLLKEPWTAIWPAFWVRSHADYPMALDRLSDAVDRADEKLV